MTASATTQFVFPLLAVALGATMLGCDSKPVAQPLVIVASGDTAGWIVPCGCASNQSGGLPRRATYLNRCRTQTEVILVEVGGAPGGSSPYDVAKFEAILRGEKLMGIAAHNIGAAEARLNPRELLRLSKSTNVPLLSANVCDTTGHLIAAPYILLSLAGQRIAIIGVLAERFATAELRVTPPHAAVLQVLASATNKYDSAIVLAYLPDEELRQLAESLPEIDAVVGGPTGQPVAAKQIGPTLLISATREGKFLACLDAPSPTSPRGWTGNIVELNDQFADDPIQVANIRAFRSHLARLDFPPEQTGFAPRLAAIPPASFSISGNNSCRKCHEAEWKVWQNTKHAVAWKSLEAKEAHVDPDCQRCHTTGYGLPGGFARAGQPAAPVDVGCESCHGPSSQHAATPSLRTAHFAQARNHCSGCHDRENSPKFVFEPYWQQIVHGQPSRVAKDPSIPSSKDGS